jgi:ribokinase
MSARIVIVGSYNQDHLWHLPRMVRPGETLRGHGFATGPGGKGFNQAVACARQGVATAFIGAHGEDALGETAEQVARAERLQGCWQIDPDHATGTACILIDADGQNRIIVDLGANEHLDATHIDAQREVFKGAKVLLTQMETGIESIRHALARGREHGLTTFLNPAPRHPQTDAECLRLADVLIPNEGEFADLCRRFADEDLDAETIAGLDDAPLHALSRKLTDSSVVITLGAKGCFVSHGAAHRGDAERCYRVAPEKVSVIDTTGAGDAFCGGLAAAHVRLAGQPFRAMVAHANRVAAIATEHHGAARAMPHHTETLSRFETSSRRSATRRVGLGPPNRR